VEAVVSASYAPESTETEKNANLNLKIDPPHPKAPKKIKTKILTLNKMSNFKNLPKRKSFTQGEDFLSKKMSLLNTKPKGDQKENHQSMSSHF
jgi:hypothetical protein